MKKRRRKKKIINQKLKEKNMVPVKVPDFKPVSYIYLSKSYLNDPEYLEREFKKFINKQVEKTLTNKQGAKKNYVVKDS